MRRLAPLCVGAMLGATIFGCGDQSTSPLLGDLRALDPGPYPGVVGRPLADSVEIRVQDPDGRALRGVAVTFETEDGSVAPKTVASDGEGLASAEWTLGTAVGAQVLRIAAGAQALEVQAVAEPGEPAQLVGVAGDAQEGFAAEPLDAPIVVRVLDEYDNPVAGAHVEWSAAPGAGSVAGLGAASDTEGLAGALWTLGENLGSVEATARVGTSVDFSFTGTALRNARIRGTVNEFGGFLAPPPPGGRIGSPEGAPAAPAGRAPASSPPHVPDELLITFTSVDGSTAAAARRSAGSPASARRLHSQIAAAARALPESEFFEVLEVSPALGVARVRVRPGTSPEVLQERLRASPGVRQVDRNDYVETIHPVRPGTEPTGPDGAGSGLAEEIWTGSRPGGTWSGSSTLSGSSASSSEGAQYEPSGDPSWRRQSWHYERILAYDAWRFTRGSPEVVVAVVDDGIRSDHPDIAGRLLPGFSFVDSTPLPLCTGGSVPADGHGFGPGPGAEIPRVYVWDFANDCIESERNIGGHGLHVAGTIAAEVDNGYLGSGVAPGVRILPVRVMDGRGFGTTFDIAQGILYAAGIPVSVGGGEPVQAAVPADIINLSLGGYGASPIREAAIQAASAMGIVIVASAGNDGLNQVSYPARYPEVIAVGAVDPFAGRAVYSNGGGDLELTAPGGAVYLGDPLLGVCSTVWNFSLSQPAYDCWQGTSMAAPHVSAVAALVWSMQPGLSHEEVRAILRDTAWNPTGGSSSYGYGIVQALPAVSGSLLLPGRHFVRLYDVNGSLLREAEVEPDGGFEFSRIPDGEYLIYAGRDAFDDGVTGLPPRIWGTYTGADGEPGPTGRPMSITVDGHGIHEASPDVGWPLESYQNTSMATADLLPVGGYLTGSIQDPLQAKYYRIPIAESGTYVFETRGTLGACGFPIAANTRLEILDSSGASLGVNDDVDAASENFCSHLTRFLEPGEYFARVTDTGGGVGYFQLIARRQGA